MNNSSDSNQDIIDQLEEFVLLLDAYEDALADNINDSRKSQRALRQEINRNIDWVRRVVEKFGCLELITVTPPAFLSGGKTYPDIDPFLNIFNPPYDVPLIDTIRDMVLKTIGNATRVAVGDDSLAAPVVSDKNVNIEFERGTVLSQCR